MAIQTQTIDKRGYTKIIKDIQSADATTATTIWNPTSGTKFVITDLIVSTDTAMSLTFNDGTNIIIRVYLTADGGFVSNFQTPIASTTTDNNFTVIASVAGNISVTATGCEV